jgi:hypothetical protein
MLEALGWEPVGFKRPDDAIAGCRYAPDRFDVILISHASQISALHPRWRGTALLRCVTVVTRFPEIETLL